MCEIDIYSKPCLFLPSSDVIRSPVPYYEPGWRIGSHLCLVIRNCINDDDDDDDEEDDDERR